MSKFYRTVELIATVKQTFTVDEETCQQCYGVGLDALDTTVAMSVDCEEDILQTLIEGDMELADHRFVVSDIQQREGDG